MITLKTTKGICCRLTSIKVPQSGVHIQNVAVTTDSSCTLTANSNASKVYHTLYPWKTLNEFAQHLYDRIVFNDGRLIAIDKPWGVGTYLAHSRTTKDTQYTLSQVPGRPRYSVNDALPSLCEKLKLDQLHVIRSLDRQTSGLMLLSHDPTLKDAIKRSINRSKVTVKPHLTFECITSGYPSTQQVKEKVAIVKEKETKQTSSSEPVIRPKSAAHRGADAYTVQVEMNVLATNQQLAVSHLQLNVNTTRWHFLRIYVTTVCSFILGELRVKPI